MNVLKNKIFILFLLFQSACTPTIHKVYTGANLPIHDVALVTVSGACSICAVNGKYFANKIPGMSSGYRYIELEAPKTYNIKIWNGEPILAGLNSKKFNLSVERGKIYQIDCDEYVQEEIYLAYLYEIKDPKKIQEIYKRISNGELKREAEK